MYGGRTIFPFVARIARIDTQATAAPQGGFSSGYDPVFRQPRNIPSSGQLGTSARQETVIEFPCQLQAREQNQFAPGLSGDSPQTTYRLIAHFRELKAAGLVDAQNVVTLGKQDRVVEILDGRGAVQTSFPDPPGLYVHEVMVRGWGLAIYEPAANLVVVTCRSRSISPR